MQPTAPSLFDDEEFAEKQVEIFRIEERLGELAKLTDPASREEAEQLADLLEEAEYARDTIVSRWFAEEN